MLYTVHWNPVLNQSPLCFHGQTIETIDVAHLVRGDDYSSDFND